MVCLGKNSELVLTPNFMGFFVCGMIVRFYDGILSTNIDNGIFKYFPNL